MQKIKELLAELSEAEFQEAAKPIEEKQISGKFYIEHVDKKTNERIPLWISFHHQIHLTWFATEFSYGASIHLNEKNGPLYPVDQINIEIKRGIDNANYTVSSYNSSQIYEMKRFRAGPAGTSCMVPEVIIEGNKYRWIPMCQSETHGYAMTKIE
jgi:hypothetical protein